MDVDSQRDRGWWLPKEVVCPYCHKSVVAKGMRKHLALTCTMVPLEIRKEMKGRMGLNQEGRIGEIFTGAFLFFFGLPFTLMPFIFYQLDESMFNSDETFTLLFFIAFSIPFVMFGLFTQSVGLRMMRGTMEWWETSGESPDPNLWDH
jgi:hypothetical protein